MLSEKQFSQIRTWVYRNAREIDLNVWKFHFENGKKEDVVSALSHYQNEDGGFGNALEPDNWNPASTPYVTLYALGLLQRIGMTDTSHPIYKGIFEYLSSEKDLTDYGWRFNVPENNNYPRAPWWNYSEDANKTESIGPTCGLCAFILQNMDKTSSVYKKAETLAKQALDNLLTAKNFGDMGIGGYIGLIDALPTLNIGDYDMPALYSKINELVNASIERDVNKWQYYGVLPSTYIHSPQSPFYPANKEIVDQEINYLLETLPENGVWNISWTWFDNMESYGKEFIISENWWKSITAIEKLCFLKNFNAAKI